MDWGKTEMMYLKLFSFLYLDELLKQVKGGLPQQTYQNFYKNNIYSEPCLATSSSSLFNS